MNWTVQLGRTSDYNLTSASFSKLRLRKETKLLWLITWLPFTGGNNMRCRSKKEKAQCHYVLIFISSLMNYETVSQAL